MSGRQSKQIENVRRTNTNEFLVCTKCNNLKKVTNFQKCDRYTRGYATWCKTCKNESQRSNSSTRRDWVENNKQAVNKLKTDYCFRNPDKVRQAKTKWRQENSKHQLALCRKYQAQKLNATPDWLTKEQFKTMTEFYKNCPVGSEVDHILPLQGNNVCGLHVPWNLQYLSVAQNRRKSNKC